MQGHGQTIYLRRILYRWVTWVYTASKVQLDLFGLYFHDIYQFPTKRLKGDHLNTHPMNRQRIWALGDYFGIWKSKYDIVYAKCTVD